MAASDKKVAVKVLAGASAKPTRDVIAGAILEVLADPEGVSCGVCQLPIDKTREVVGVELAELVVDEELVVVALLLCPRCAAENLGQIEFSPTIGAAHDLH